MSVIWTTIAIVAFLFPGVFFFIGLATYEAQSRDIIRSGVISEIALATACAIVLHLACLSSLSAIGFRFSDFVVPFVHYSLPLDDLQVRAISQRLAPAALYLVITSALGFLLGAVISRLIFGGRLRFLARHQWFYDIVDHDRRGGIVSVFVLTTTIENEKALMYRGRLHDIFLGPDGKIAYVTLKSCSRCFMDFTGTAPAIGTPLDLFEGQTPLSRIWDYLLIDGGNIANILFDPSSETLQLTGQGIKALEASEQRVRAEQAGQSAGAPASPNTPSTSARSLSAPHIPWYRR